MTIITKPIETMFQSLCNIFACFRLDIPRGESGFISVAYMYSIVLLSTPPPYTTLKSFPWTPLTVTLPLELINEVVEVVASHNKATALMALVSRDFNEWVHPALHWSVPPHGELQANFFIQGLKEARCNGDDPTQYTRRLCINGDPIDKCDSIFSLFGDRNIEQILLILRYPHSSTPDDVVQDTELWLRLWYAIVLWKSDQWFHRRLALFACITDLDEVLELGSLDAAIPLPLINFGFGFWEEYNDHETVITAVYTFWRRKSVRVILVQPLQPGLLSGQHIG